jgi:hypothetical protein
MSSGSKYSLLELEIFSSGTRNILFWKTGTQNSIGKTSDAIKNHLSFYLFVLNEISVLNELGPKIEPCGTSY